MNDTAVSDRLRFPSLIKDRLVSGDWQIVVTGAGGWFGRATLEMLEDALGPQFDRRVAAFARTSRDMPLRSGRQVRLGAMSELRDLRQSGDVLVAHYAFLTREKIGEGALDAYVNTNRGLTSLIEAQAKRLGAVGSFSTSSGAVYGKDRKLDSELAANPYGVLKLEEEAAFVRLRDAGIDAAICRVFNVSGPFLNKDYALGSLIAAALQGSDLVIRARNEVFRSYAHVRDIVAVGFAVMTGLTSVPLAAYDTAGSEVVEVGALAARVAHVLGCVDRPITRDPLLFSNVEDRYVGDRAVFAELARAADIALASLDEQIRDTARYFRWRQERELPSS